MNKNEKKMFNGKLYKSNKSIPSSIGKYSTEEDNNAKTIITHHRKKISSFFIGSYIAENELNKLLKENNDKTSYENKKISDFFYDETNSLSKNTNINIHELKNSLLKEKENNLNSSNTNLNTNDNDKCIPFSNSSFYSFTNENEENKDELNQNNTIRTSLTLNTDIIINPNEFNNANTPNTNFIINDAYNRDKSFLPLKNTLKYLKDKEERLTESYLMALNGSQNLDKDEKNQYLPTVSIIEEEKSEFVETTNKKASIINNSLLLLDKGLKKRKIENEFQENKENINNNANNNMINDEKYKKLNVELNKIIIKNSYEEENNDNYIKKNKTNINYFNKKNSNIKLNQKAGNKKIDLLSKVKNNSKNKITIKTLKKNEITSPQMISVKKRRTLSYCEAKKSTLVHHKRFNTENKFKKIEPGEKYNISNLINKKIIQNIYKKSKDNLKEKEAEAKNKLNKSLNNLLTSRIKIRAKVPRIKFLDDKKKEIKICVKKLQNNLSINNFKKQKKRSTISLNLKHKKSISFSNPSCDNNYKHIKTFSNINTVENIINSSLLKQKQKNNKLNKNNGKIHKNNVKSKSKDKNLILKNSNINKTIKVLNEKIFFSQMSEKIEVSKKFQSNNYINKDNYIIFCKKRGNSNSLYDFKGLYKYLDKENKYNKIIGDKKYPNNVLITNLNNKDYVMYESGIINKENIPIIVLNNVNIVNISRVCKIICEKY